MGICIYYSMPGDPLSEQDWTAMTSCLPEELLRKAERLRHQADRQAAVIGKWMLAKAMKDHGIPGGLERLRYTPQGRPYIGPGFDFNISHSGRAVVLACSRRSRVGVDLESVQPLELSLYRQHIPPKAWAEINASPDPSAEFYHYWTSREAILKAAGPGLNASPLSVETLSDGAVRFNQQRWYLRNVNLAPGYVCHLASSGEPAALEMFHLVG